MPIMPKNEITAEQVRAHLIGRIGSFQAHTKMTDANVGTSAVGDHKVIARIRAGENFTLKTYQRLLDWIDEQERAAA